MAPIHWKSAVGGDWSEGSNWVGGVAPGAGDDAVIDPGGTYTVTISTAISANSLILSAAGAIVTETAGGSLTLAGALTLTAGTLQLNSGATTVGGLTQLGGSLADTGTLTVSGTAVLSGGGMEGGSKSAVQGALVAQGPLIIAGGTALDGGWTLTAEGTTNWTSGYIYFGYNPAGTSIGGTNTLVNAAKAIFDDQNTAGYEIVQYTGTGIFDNAGLFDKTVASGASTTTVSTVFNNQSTGTVKVDAGTLSLTGGGTETGAFIVAAGATLEFDGGSFALNNASAISSSGTLQVGGGTVSESGTLSDGGTLEITGGTLTATGTITAASFSQSGGSLADTGTLTVSGTAVLSGGGMEGGSKSAVQGALVAQGPLIIAGGTTALDGGWTLTAEGATNWTSGYIYFGYNPVGTSIGGTNTLVNAAKATFDDQNTAGYEIVQYTGTGIFDNAGLFDKTVASGASTTTVSTVFNNQSTGTVKVDAGTLSLTGGGTETGAFIVAAGATLEFDGGSFALNNASAISSSGTLQVGGGTVSESGTLSDGGTLEITGGTLTATGTITAASFSQSGGSLADTGTLTVSGTAVLSGGGMEGGSKSAVQGALVAQGPLIIAGGTTALDGGWTLTAEGTTNWTSGYIYFGYNPVGTSIGGTNTLVNAAKATFDDQNTAGYEIVQYTGTGIFDNAGLFDKTVASGASTTTVSTVFNNQSTGTVKVDAGTLSLTGGGTETGAFTVAAGATLEFDGGSFALNNASAISSSGTLQVGGGTVSESGTLSDGGTLEITGGTLTATGTITAASFSQSGGSLADTGTLTVSGTTVLSGGGMEGGSKSAVQGALVAQGPLIIAGGTTALDGGWTLTAEGTTNWTSGYIYFGYNPVGTSIGGTNTLVNAAKATFDDQNTAGYEIIQYTGTGIFDNAGLFDKTVASGASTTTVSTVFNNQSTGTVKVDAGTLSLTGDTANSGILEAQGGVLEITTAITGAGRLSIGAGAEASEIELGGAASETVVFNGTAATLKLDQPATYTGTLSGFAAGDILDLASTNAVSATPGAFNGTTTALTVALKAGGTLTYTLAGNYSSDSFSTSLNGSDTDITLGFLPAAPIHWKSAVGGDWSEGSNWVGGVAPGAGDDAVIDPGGTYTVTISTAISANSLILSAAGAIVTETAGGSLTLAGALTLTAGTLQLNSGATTVGGLTQLGGSLADTGTLTVSGTAVLSGGGMEGGSKSAVQGALVAQGPLIIAGGTALDGGWTLTAEGTTNWTSGYIYFGYNPAGTSIGGTNTLVNAAKAIFDDQNTAGYEIVQYTGTGIFDNAGLFDKTVASGASTTTVSTVFNNQSTGTVKVDAGTLSLTGGGTETGAFIVAAGATLEFDGGSFALNNASAISSSGTLQVGGGTVSESGTLSDGGTLEITGGTLTATGTITAASFSQSGGSLADTGTLTVSGTAVLSGGGMEGGSKSAVQGALVAQGPLIIAGGTTALDGGWTLTAEGATNWTSGYIYFGYNPVGTSIGGTNTLVNAAKATFDDQNTAGYEIVQYTGTGIFDNAGLFDKTVASGASTTTVSTVFNNQSTGTVKVDAGTLSLTGGGTETGAFIVAAGATLEFDGGSFALNNASAISSSGTLQVGGGTVSESGTLSDGGTLEITGGTLTATGTITAASFSQSGGSLADTGTLTVSGTAVLSGGGMEGGSKSAVQGALVAQGPLIIAGGTTALDGGWTLTAEGTTNWTSGYIYFGYNPVGTSIGGTNTLVNAAKATFDDQNTAGYEIVQYTGTGIFDNAGLFDKTVASGASTTTVSTVFNNQSTGTVKVDAGTLSLTGGGTETGAFTVAAGATLEFDGGSFALNNASAISSSGTLQVGGGTVSESGTLSDGGTLEITGGTLTATGTITAASFSQSGGSLADTGTLTVSGTTVLSGGGMEGGSKSAVQGALVAQGPLIIAGGTTALDGGWTLTAEGTTNWTSGYIYFGYNPVGTSIGGTNTLVNAAKATFDDQNTAGYEIVQYTGTGIFDNAGLFDKTVASGASTTTVSTVFNNQSTGTVKVDAGTLSLTGGGTETGAFIVAAGATLEFDGGSFALNNASAISSSGTLQVGGGTVSESGTLSDGGTLEITGGTLTATGTITAASFSQSGGSLADTGTLTVSGTTVLSGGGMEGGSKSAVQGALVAQGPLIIAGGTTALDGGWTLTAEGTTNWTSGYIYFGYNPVGTSIGGTNTLVNAAKATFDDQNTAGYEIIQYTGTGIFDNAGLFDKTVASGASTTTVSTVFNNQSTGTVKVDAGTLSLTGDTANSGILEAQGGVLEITTAITGAGRLSIGAGAEASEIELGGAASETVVFNGTAATLKLDQPATYTGTLSGFAAGDILDLASTNAVSATPGAFNGTTTALTVALKAGGTLTYTLAGNYSSDSFSTSLNGSDTDIKVIISRIPPPALFITAPAAATVGVGRAEAIPGVSLSQSPTTSGETFTVTLSDTNGLLSATGTGVSGTGTTSLTINSSLSQVNSDLATLTDKDAATAGSDTITLNASDSFGNTASHKSIAVTVNGLPAISAPASATVHQNQATAITGISLAETGNISGESFTVSLGDITGVLSATTVTTGGGGTITSSNGGRTLKIAGTLAQVDADLRTLTDKDATAGSDTITLNASDSFGNTASHKSIAVTVNGLPAISAPASATVHQNQATAITGISLAETGNISGESFTVNLGDITGVLSATTVTTGGGGTITSSNGGRTLKIAGTLAQVDADLRTLTDKDATAGSDTITLNASDSFGNTASHKSIAVTVNGLPAISASASATVHQNQATAITGISLAETGNISGESFTVSLGDITGVLSATTVTTGGGGTITSSNGGRTLKIAGTLAQVDADLRTLTDKDATAGSDTITLNASDSFGNTASHKSIAVTVNGLPAISAPASATVHQNQATAITGISLAETGNISGESFTVSLGDITGVLSATTVTTGGGGTITSSNGGRTLKIAGTLAQVDADLRTLTDKDATAGSDTITLNASDSFGSTASHKSIAVTVSSLTTTVPRAQIVEIAKVTPISGISVAATGNASDETFKVTLSDTLGALSANTDAAGGGGSITGSGTATLVISGTLAEVDADLSTFTYLASTAGTDTIHIATVDTSGGRSNQQLAVTVDHPAVAAFQKVSGAGELTQNGNAYTLDFGTIGQGVTAPTVVIDVLNAATGPADMLSGSFSVAGEAAPYNALVDIGLNAIRPLAAGAASGQTEVLFQSEITGSFAETLTLAATGSNASGYSASLGTKSLTIEGTIAPPSGRVFDLTTGPDTFVEPPRGSDNTVIATANTLSAGDDIDSGGGGGNILVLQGSGIFNMTLPGALADFDKVTAQEGQPSYEHDGVVYVSQTQTVDLRRALDATVDVAPASINSANPNAPTITIVGATDDNSTINLASGNDTVTLGAAQETVHGGGGSNTFYVNAVTIGATINGGSGTNVLDVTGGGTMAMGANIKQIADAVLIGSSIPYDFTANAVSGLLINDLGTRTADTLIAGGSNQILTGGGAGKLTVNAANQTDVLLKDTAALFTGDTVEDLVKGDMIDITGLAFSAAHTSLGFAFNKASDTTTMSVAVSGTQKTAITLLGQYMASDFKVSADTAGTGTLITLIHELNLTMPH